MSDATPQAEPTMEEILASIRRIISEDEPQTEEFLKPEPDLSAEPEAAPEAEPEAASEPEPAPAEAADVLELTRMVTEDGTIVDLEAKRSAAADQAAEPDPEPEPEPGPEPETQAELEPEPEPVPFPEPFPEASGAEAPDPCFAADQDSLLSPSTQFATVDSLSEIAAAALGARATGPAGLGSGRSLEEFMHEALTPVLKAWLDTNLSPLVEQVVREEIKRMVRRAEDL